MKNKETLEEVAENYSFTAFSGRQDLYDGFIAGAKWQLKQFTIEEQSVGHTIDELDKEYIKGFNEGSAYYIERMYSEEEVILIIEKFRDLKMIAFSEWFEQFKKK